MLHGCRCSRIFLPLLVGALIDPGLGHTVQLVFYGHPNHPNLAAVAVVSDQVATLFMVLLYCSNTSTGIIA